MFTMFGQASAHKKGAHWGQKMSAIILIFSDLKLKSSDGFQVQKALSSYSLTA